jgi:penicillin-binding protein 2
MEEAFEDYLHGIDGTRVDVVSRAGTIIKQYYANKYDEETGEVIGQMTPIAGNNVETTIDLDIQIATEDALAKIMKEITNPELNKKGEKQGLDAEGAAAIVMDVKTGDILACASYPTYNLATMNEDWKEIEADPNKPFFNRAFGATYAPGSTYKMVTLTAAMNNKNKAGEVIFNPDDTIVAKGIWNERMPGFGPTCMIWSWETPYTHGELTAPNALKVSCNYFFYELAYLVTIDMLDDAAKAYGLGEPTGIELYEKVGHRSNEESKKASYTTAVNQQWSAGDRVLTGIGQAENRFTPLQLCVYASTLANKGTRMKATFLNRVVSSDYRTLILDQEPQVLSTMENISWETWEIIFTGMRKVVASNGGTADDFLGGFNDANAKNLEWPKDGVRWPLANEVTVYAKTGTSEHSSGGSDHGAFICFAHRKELTEPEVAVAVFGEKAAHGNWLAPVAEDILEAYFEQVSASTVYTYENQVG